MIKNQKSSQPKCDAVGLSAKVSYFSDIDLATLHRSRLNERIQYKLSWLNGRQKCTIPLATPTAKKPQTFTAIDRKKSTTIATRTMHTNDGGGGGEKTQPIATKAIRNKTIDCDRNDTKNVMKRRDQNGRSTECKVTQCDESANCCNGDEINDRLSVPKPIASAANGNHSNGDAPSTATAASPSTTAENQAIDDNFSVAHRKRSGTWP